MIIDLLIRGLGFVIDRINDLIAQTPDPPDFVTNFGDLGGVSAFISHVGYWAPVPLLLSVGGVVIATRILLWSVTGVRLVISLFTGGGGAV